MRDTTAGIPPPRQPYYVGTACDPLLLGGHRRDIHRCGPDHAVGVQSFQPLLLADLTGMLYGICSALGAMHLQHRNRPHPLMHLCTNHA